MFGFKAKKENERLRKLAIEYINRIDKADSRIADLEYVLIQIAQQEKPTSNSTVKRMAKMAVEALEK